MRCGQKLANTAGLGPSGDLNPMSLHDQLGPAARPRSRRRRSAMVAGAAAVLLTVTGISALVAQRAAHDDSDEASPSGPVDQAWADAGVPYQDREGYHFLGRSTKHDAAREPEAVAITADAAVFVHDLRSYPDPAKDDYEAEGNPLIGTVSALFADGDFEVIGKDVLGVPFADPDSHVVMWMTWTGVDSAEVTAYDTDQRKVLATHPLAYGSESLWGVEGGTAYLSGDEGPLTWTPENDPEPQPIDGLRGFKGVVMDATLERLLTLNFQSEGGSAIRDRSGVVLKRLRGFWFGTFNPDGAYLVLNTGQEHRLLDSTTFEEISLDLPAKPANSVARWGSTGTLVVTRTPLESEDVEEEWYLQTHFACTIPSGACLKLPGDAMLPLNEASALGQFGLLVAVAFA
jgi:hypothetical protein